MTHIGQNIKYFIDKKGIRQADLARSLNTTPQNVTNLLKTKNPSAETLMDVSKVLDIGFEVLMDREKEIINKLVDEPTTEINKLTNYKPKSTDLIPYYDKDFIAGTVFETVESQISVPDYYMDVPEFRGCTAFRAYSDSMEGIIKSGSVLFGTKVEEWREYLEYGQIYGIVCEDGRRFLKYIRRYMEAPKEFFLLQSENKFYDDFEMPKNRIRSIWLIHGHLNKRV